ncbi:hypothetical protein M2336_001699 [Sphingobium sp. B1D7B]|uniref:hypothetical protein n=1 Tax=Sphingobium sp. B1D7B TaxID=2940578 RepID=UPI002223F60A|nr:hypothetical protein [Sphingobium sp. B1D7B]MCW2405070.1 hypothetical protein [Sphingobium sp. B1D7B]
MATPVSSKALLRSIIENLEEIAARGDFANADVRITDGLDAAQDAAQAALDYLNADVPTGRYDDWYPAPSFASLGLRRTA